MKPLDRSEGDINQTARRAAWQAEHLDREASRLLAEDARYFLHQSLSTPCLNALRRVEGSCIEDVQGRRYLDFHGNSVHQVGYANPDVIAAIKAQLDAMAFCPRRYTNQVAVDLAQKLATIAPGDLNRVLFCPGGTGAIGMALKLARVATGRYKTISMWDSFHGASLDAISVGGEEVFRGGIGPLLPGTSHVPPPGEYRCMWRCHEQGGCQLQCADYIEYVLQHEGDVAAVIAEPIRCTPFIPHADYWRRVRAACDRHGALLIFDEIPIGLGRTGAMFACEHFGVVPDMLVLGKGLGGGIMPLAALLARDELNVAADRALGHYTHEKSPVACAAALATIRHIEEHRLVERARELGAHAMSRLELLKQKHAAIGDVRGRGLLLGVELVTDRESRRPDVETAEGVLYRCLELGLSFKLTMGNILTLTPPLTIAIEELDQAIDIIDQALTEASLPG